MKVLISRTLSLISSRLAIEAINYHWSVRSEYAILIRIMKYLRITTFRPTSLGVPIYINWELITPFNFRELFYSLSAESLRSIIKLSEYILKRPEYLISLSNLLTLFQLYNLKRFYVRVVQTINTSEYILD